MYYLKILVIPLLTIAFIFCTVNERGLSLNLSEAKKYNDTKIATNADVYDPLEIVNRPVYEFNNFLDKILLKPIAKTYRFIVPEFGRRSVRNILNNLKEPVNMLNSGLQGDKEQSFTAFWRFALNSTFGLGGTFDFAGKHANLERRTEDFGQTMGVFGVGNGPYLVLPILGPSNTRDLFGLAVDAVSDPFNYMDKDFTTIRSAVDGVSKREFYLDITDEIERVSLDPYAAMRSLYTQRRLDEIENGGI